MSETTRRRAEDDSGARSLLAERPQSWQGILDRFFQLYSPFKPQPWAGAPLDRPLNPNILSLDSSFTFTRHPDDKRFSPWRTEELLNQATNILDRCLAARAERDEWALKAANVWLEVTQYVENEAVLQEEVKFGLNAIPYRQSKREWEAAKKQVEALDDTLNKIEVLRTKIGSDQVELARLAGNAAYASGRASYVISPQTEKGISYLESPGPFSSQKRTVSDSLCEHALAQNNFSLDVQRLLLDMERALRSGEREATNERAQGWDDRSDWDWRDIEYRKRRLDTLRKVADLKVRMMVEEGGALNFVEKLEDAATRCKRDLRDALARLEPAATGLRLIYGYSLPLPQSVRSVLASSTPPNPSAYPTLATDSIMWVRDAVAWLLRHRHGERQYLTCLSLKSLMAASDWEAFLQHGSTRFEIPASKFAGDEAVRVQAVGAEIEGKVGGYWALELTAPEKSHYAHGRAGTADADQSMLTPARLGGITKRTPFMRPSLHGGSLHNASPIGLWKINVLEGNRSAATDLFIHLHVATRVEVT